MVMSAWIPVDVAAVLLLAAAVLLLVAAVQDVATRTIPNRLVLSVAAVGMALRILAGGAVPSLLAGSAVLAAGMVCWQRGYLGGGDAKLLVAASLLVPASQVIALVLATAVAGGLLGLVYLFLRRFCVRPRFIRGPTPELIPARILRIELWRLRHGISLPYATAIAAGTLFILGRG
jgi:prepilin peptidase CpaA